MIHLPLRKGENSKKFGFLMISWDHWSRKKIRKWPGPYRMCIQVTRQFLQVCLFSLPCIVLVDEHDTNVSVDKKHKAMAFNCWALYIVNSILCLMLSNGPSSSVSSGPCKKQQSTFVPKFGNAAAWNGTVCVIPSERYWSVPGCLRLETVSKRWFAVARVRHYVNTS